MEALEVFSTVIGHCWDILAFTVPGLGISCQVFVTAILLINISIAVAHFAFGFGGSGSSYRSGQSSRKHISENRKGDEK